MDKSIQNSLVPNEPFKRVVQSEFKQNVLPFHPSPHESCIVNVTIESSHGNEKLISKNKMMIFMFQYKNKMILELVMLQDFTGQILFDHLFDY